MRRGFRWFLVALASFPALAHAAAVSPPGVNIRWDRCFADAGVWNRTFACDTNTGSETLVLSFELDTPMADVSGQEIVVDLVTASANLPAWWQMWNAGTCRQSALSMNLSPPPGTVNCADWSTGTEAGGIGAYVVNPHGFIPNSSRIVAAAAVPASEIVTLNAGQEYFSASFGINHTKTVGLGACSGCDVPVCIVFESLKLRTPVAGTVRRLYHGANWQGSQIAYWQNAYATNISFSCNRFGTSCNTFFSCVPYDVTRSGRSTWGEVKALYR